MWSASSSQSGFSSHTSRLASSGFQAGAAPWTLLGTDGGTQRGLGRGKKAPRERTWQQGPSPEMGFHHLDGERGLPVIDVIPLVSPRHLGAGTFGDEGYGDRAGGEGGPGPPPPRPCPHPRGVRAVSGHGHHGHSPSELGDSSALTECSGAAGEGLRCSIPPGLPPPASPSPCSQPSPRSDPSPGPPKS